MSSASGTRLLRVDPAGPGWSGIGIDLAQADPGSAGRRVEGGSRRTGSDPGAEEAQTHVTLELDALEKAGKLARATSRSALASTFRRLKLPLVANARHATDRSARRSLIMVTSAVAGEGKTFCATNLALSIAAEVDSSVLLVDADSEHAGLMRQFGVQTRPGLYDLLTQPELRLSDVVLQTNVPRLELLPPGTPHSLPGELLASEAMQRLLENITIGDPGRIVIFDAPALLASAEAPVLASIAGQIVFVVQASRTPQRTVMQALALVDHRDLVLPLLNKSGRLRQA